MEIKDPKLAEQVKEWRQTHKQSGVQRRYVCDDVRLDFAAKQPVIVGYAAVFNQRTKLWDGFYEEVAPGAFRNAIGRDDVRALINHDPNLLLGRTMAGTLKLSEDEKGLRYEIIPPETSYSKDLQVSLKRQDINQSSFGFNIVEYDERKDAKTGERTITLKEVKLFDVSPVTFPAYPGTEAHVRMAVGENEIAYLYEDSGEVILCSLADTTKVEISDEELFERMDSVIKGLYK